MAQKFIGPLGGEFDVDNPEPGKFRTTLVEDQRIIVFGGETKQHIRRWIGVGLPGESDDWWPSTCHAHGLDYFDPKECRWIPNGELPER